MTKITALPTALVRALQSGGLDANDQKPETTHSSGPGNPCRHCLKNIPEGQDMLILAHRPFPALQPYAETGPIFLCADSCERYAEADIPEVLTTSPDYLLKGYNQADRIVYGTGAVVEAGTLANRAVDIFENPDVAYIHIRSSRNNCYQARIDRS
jgi:uncharacterized protein DUF1203